MSKSQFQIARATTREFLRHKNITNHNFYGPVSDQYWNEPFRVVAVNMDSYGYPDLYEMDCNELIRWLNDAGHTRTKTARYTLAILTLLLARVIHGKHPSREDFTAAFRDKVLLEQTLDRTVYYNIRPESNQNKEQDFAAIAAVGASELGALLWSEIQAFDPHVVIVSGVAGLAALNGCAKLNPALHFRKQIVSQDGFLIQSIAHPSRPNYTTSCSMIDGIGNWVSEIEQGRETKRLPSVDHPITTVKP